MLKIDIHKKGGLRQYDAIIAIVRAGSSVADYQEALGEIIGKFVATAATKHRFKGENGKLAIFHTSDTSLPGTIVVAGCWLPEGL